MDRRRQAVRGQQRGGGRERFVYRLTAEGMKAFEEFERSNGKAAYSKTRRTSEVAEAHASEFLGRVGDRFLTRAASSCAIRSNVSPAS